MSVVLFVIVALPSLVSISEHFGYVLWNVLYSHTLYRVFHDMWTLLQEVIS